MKKKMLFSFWLAVFLGILLLSPQFFFGKKKKSKTHPYKEAPPIKVLGSIDARFFPNGSMDQTIAFYPTAANKLVKNLIIKVDGVQVPEMQTYYGLIKIFNITSKQNVSVTIQYSPKFTAAITANGNIEQPVTITYPANNAVINPNSNLNVTWTPGVATGYECTIQKVDPNGQPLSEKKVYSPQLLGTSKSVPASVLEPNTQYRIVLVQILDNIRIKGSASLISKITHRYIHYRLFRTR